MKRYVWPGVALVGLLALASDCASGSRLSRITPGAVKKHVQKGVTTQAEVIEIFGTPNIVTMKEPYEMWVYDRVSSRQASSILGSTRRSETTVMLIVYFDDDAVVADYRLAQAKF
ncbi:MAG: hypothetical protein ACE5E5_09450 [Phycisphaerae bacterium]